ncbi:ATP-dependent DNA helicase RecG [Arcanobacterium bovis]|uniref:Probable DNA 3'-5' helicase RecG n=1 Tax=Arcanobacterium bovis TaxID=2529275 RepID=A0A4Q9V0U7_9ACTO|nr:ATP-dependent DNA helicase RecG [Arcanobacterium bovis]
MHCEEQGLLSAPLERYLGKRSANALAKLNLHTVQDLVFHIPFRLAKRGELMPIQAVNEGDSVTVVARVLSSHIRPMNNRRGFILTVMIGEGMHELELTFFAKHERPLKFHAMKLEPGALAIFSGTVSSYRGALQLTHPEYELIDDGAAVDPQELARPIPIYHAAQKVPSWQIARAVEVLLPQLNESILPDPLPKGWRAQNNLPSRLDALRWLHQPPTEEHWRTAQLRMKYEEAVLLQTVLARRAHRARVLPAPVCKRREDGVLQVFDSMLPFDLTAGQRQVGEEIASDLATEVPMRRLLQGDVGAGKTVVAVRAILQAIDAGKQAVLLAPTEVLAQQHFNSVKALMGELADGGLLGASENAITVELLTGSMSAKEKRAALLRIASGQAQFIIGTHALIQDRVQIPFLGLLIVDEQHRFGVDQRDKLAQGVHMLVMTATPIPRTVAMTTFGDLSVSTLAELPKGRAPITTQLVPAWKETWIDRIWERAREEIDSGGQVYVVCPRILATDTEDDGDEQYVSDEHHGGTGVVQALAAFETDPQRELNSVEKIFGELREKPQLQGINIAAIHGQMAGAEKERIMADFANGQVQMLVSTTVIEVGVDNPRASLMVIMDADRFGLSQLHQLRGRIGRGSRPSLCLAVHSASDGTVAHARLAAFAHTTDGFELARADIELRSEGNVLGSQQSGQRSSLQFLSVLKDENIITQAKEFAVKLIASDPDLVRNAQLAHEVRELEGASETSYLEKG